ncbi:MAG: 7,8-didemethyl-8-hydroxy-5-deazariboflavin synthase subunit CofG [Acidobacteria bacterium]|nr:MAG: 7,8-didemethyl-8-hydroxy-5-deazariboflavin synthase subunit CofG [Acidobacteriota bacterium]
MVEMAEEIGAASGGDGVAADSVEELAWLLTPEARIEALLEAASTKRDAATGDTLSFSPKVFVDLTRLCRDRCSYCTFVRTPLAERIPLRGEKAGAGEPKPYLEQDEVLEIALAGARAGCKEALFTLGDRPEDRYESARRFLSDRGYSSTAEYVTACARLVLDEAKLLPHVNPGVMTADEIAEYRKVSASAGLMLESTSRALFEDPGGCHYGSPDKDPDVRLACIADAGRAKVPFTTGMLIGIGESLIDRVETILAMASLAREFGHIQEVIVQNFRAKPASPMRSHLEPEFDEYLRVIALARLILPARVAVQAPPNLTPEYEGLLAAGMSDWGGISPVTPDHVNPEAPWPEVAELAKRCAHLGFALRSRLALHPSFVIEGGWVDPAVEGRVLEMSDSQGWAL